MALIDLLVLAALMDSFTSFRFLQIFCKKKIPPIPVKKDL